MVFGLVVRSRGLGATSMAGLRSLGGGEIHEYTQPARGHPPPGPRPPGLERHAARRQRGPVDALRQLGAVGHDAEIVAYGTAVIVVAGRERRPRRPAE